jgi:hypothetical protein
MRIFHTNDSQHLLNRNVQGLGIAGLLFLLVLSFSPVLFTSFVIGFELLGHRQPNLSQLRDIFLVAGGIYMLLFFAKGFMLYCKARHYLVWLPVFLCCVAYTCVPPGIFVFYMLSHLMPPIVAACIAVIFGYLVYRQYHFLSDTNAGIATPFYRLGINLADLLYRAIEKKKGRVE